MCVESTADAPDVPWLAFDDPSAWDCILHLGSEVHWPSKSLVRSPGDKADCIFLIRSGVLKVAASNREGLQRTLWFMGAGSVLGEAAMLSDKPYRHHVTAVEPSVAYRFTRQTVMDRILPDYPELNLRLLVNIATKSYISSSQVENSTFLSGPRRVARLLIGLGQARDSAQLRLSHADIADMLGVHRVTVSNTVRLFKRNGFLDESTHGIQIIDMDAIEAFAQDGS